MSDIFKKPTYFELNGETASAIPNSSGGVTITKPSHLYFADFLQDGSEITKEAYEKLNKKALTTTNKNKKKVKTKGKTKVNKKEQDSEIVFIPNLV